LSNAEREELERRKAKARQLVAQALQRDLSEPSVEVYWKNINRYLKNMNALNIGGLWQLEDLTCGPKNCTVKWLNPGGSSQAAIDNAVKDICEPIFMPQGDGAQCSFNYTLERQDTLELSNEEYVDDYQLREQLLMLKRIMETKSKISPAGFDRSVPDSQLLEKHELYLKGSWELKIELVVLDEVAGALSREFLRTLWADKLKVKCSNRKCDVIVGGRYVGKK
jgi:hypothetical protein